MENGVGLDFYEGKNTLKKTMEEKEEKGEEKKIGREGGEERRGEEERKKRMIDSQYPGLSGPSHSKGIS